MARCIECDGDLQADDASLEVGEVVICPECGAELKVLSGKPLKLQAIPDDDEDGE